MAKNKFLTGILKISVLFLFLWIQGKSLPPVSGDDKSLIALLGEETPVMLSLLESWLRENLSDEEKTIFDRILGGYQATITNLLEENQNLLQLNEELKEDNKRLEEENRNLTKEIGEIVQQVYWGPNDLDLKVEEGVRKVLYKRIRFIHDKSNPRYPLPEEVLLDYVEWTYKWAKAYNIPVLFFAAVAEAETNWVSKDTYDKGDSWTAFSMQISTIREVLKYLGHPIPHDPNAKYKSLRQVNRYRNFVAVYKSKLFDRNLDMKELVFQIAAAHINRLHKRYNGDLAQVALAYNTGSSFSKEISASYPMNVLGRYYYLCSLLREELTTET